LVGFSAGFMLTLILSRRIFMKIIGKSWREMTVTEYIIFRYGSRLLVILALVVLFIGYLATENLSLDS
jgi:hypothetical protein